MKQLLGILLVISVLGFSTAYFLSPSFAHTITDAVSYSHCDTPTTYNIGSIDERFAITEEELTPLVEQSAKVWNEAYGKNIFVHDDSEGDLTVNLVYDERQKLTSQIGQLHEQLEDEKSTIDPQIAEFERRVRAFKERVASFNSTIEYWNSRGGAPEGEFEKLQAEQIALQREQSELDTMASLLNRSTNEYNSQVGQLNQTIDTFNNALKTRPEEGLYNGRDNTITIYFMANTTELVHTLTHEFGHAVGIEHLNNPQAIMYYQTNDQLALTQDDISALAFACRERSIFELASERVVYLGRIVEETFQRYQLIP